MKKVAVFLGSVVVGFLLAPALSLAGGSFYIDEVTSFVGIGNTTPAARLDVSGAMYSRLVTATSSTITWGAGNVQSLTLSSNQTLTFANAQAGGEYKLILKQDGTGGRTVVWPASVIWSGGTPPVLTTTANVVDVASFIYDGTTYLGSYQLNYINGSSLLSNLLSYWKFDESSGNALDSSGGNTLTNHNTATYTAGKINNAAFIIATSSQYFSHAYNSSLNLANSSFSETFWVKLNTAPASGNAFGFVGMYEGAGSVKAHVFYYHNTGSTYELRLAIENSSPSDVGVTSTISTGTFHHVAVTYNATTGDTKFYIDGSQVGTTQTSSTGGPHSSGGTPDFTVGAYGNSPSSFLDGAIDELGVWDKELSGSDISQLYNSGSGNQYPF